MINKLVIFLTNFLPQVWLFNVTNYLTWGLIKSIVYVNKQCMPLPRLQSGCLFPGCNRVCKWRHTATDEKVSVISRSFLMIVDCGVLMKMLTCSNH